MKLFALIFSLVLCSPAYPREDKTYKAHWHEKDQSDFQSVTANFQYSEKEHFFYCISNDNENIYVDLKIKDMDLQRQLIRSGIMIWLDPKDGRKKKTGIKYPVRPVNPGPGMRQPGRNNQYSERPASINDELNSMQLIGFSKSGPEIIQSGKYNIKGSITRDNVYTYYEVVIPLAKFSELNPEYKKTALFSIGISYNQTVPPSGNGSFNGNRPQGGSGFGVGATGRGRPGGGGMRGSGGTPGGGMPRGGGFQGNNSGTEKLMWIKDITLASE